MFLVAKYKLMMQSTLLRHTKGSISSQNVSLMRVQLIVTSFSTLISPCTLMISTKLPELSQTGRNYYGTPPLHQSHCPTLIFKLSSKRYEYIIGPNKGSTTYSNFFYTVPHMQINERNNNMSTICRMFSSMPSRILQSFASKCLVLIVCDFSVIHLNALTLSSYIIGF
jgi:hypothetical protein